MAGWLGEQREGADVGGYGRVHPCMPFAIRFAFLPSSGDVSDVSSALSVSKERRIMSTSAVASGS